MNNWFVIGGGWTVSQWDLRDLQWFGKIIGVNDAALWTPGCDIALTMDRLWFEHRWQYLKTIRMGETYVRQKCDCNVKRKDARDNWQTFTHFHKPGLGVNPGELYGGNSGACGVNLAFQRAKECERIFLLGFDMQKGPGNEPYWYPAYPWIKPEGATNPTRYREWSDGFGAINKQIKEAGIEFYNVSNRSRITSVETISWDNMWEIID